MATASPAHNRMGKVKDRQIASSVRRCAPLALAMAIAMAALGILPPAMARSNPPAQSTPNGSAAPPAGGTVYLVLPTELAQALQPELQRFGEDLAEEGLALEIKAGQWTDPAQLRATLQQGWQTQGLVGAILVGDIPSIRYNHRPRTDYYHDYPTDMYYMDLDGGWQDQDGDGTYDQWDASEPEIWVSRLRADNLPLLGDEVSLLRAYFDRNHAYRSGTLELPPERALVVYHNIDVLRSQQEFDGWGASPDLLFDQVQVRGPASPQELSEDPGDPITQQARRDWLAALQDPEGYQLMVLNTASYPTQHMFAGAYEGDSNQLSAAEIAQMGPKRALWFHFLTSEVGYHPAADYLGGVYLFDSPTALAAYAGLQHSGVAASRALYQALADGASFGEALLADARFRVQNAGTAYTEYVAWTASRTETWRWDLPAASVLLGDGTLRLPGAQTPPPDLTLPQNTMGELSFQAQSPPSNPFTQVSLTVTFQGPQGQQISVPGFYDGGSTWKVRFTLPRPGRWTWAAQGSDPGLRGQGSVQVQPSDAPGFVRPQGHNFAYQNGTPFFYMGDTSYRAIILDRAQRTAYFARRAGQGFSHIRFLAGYVQDGPWPWGGSPSNPDLERFNLQYFQQLDSLMAQLMEHGLGAEMILLNLYDRPVNDPSQWTRQDEDRWLRYLIARYAAYPNLIQWTVANEYELYPDGKYQIDLSDPLPQEVVWGRDRIAFIQSQDPFDHPVAIHPEITDDRAAEFFPDADLIQHQTNGQDKVDRGCYYTWEGDGLSEFVVADRSLGKPVVVGEFGYETNGYTCRGVNVDTDTLRKSAWRFRMGGAYFSAGFRSTVYNFDGITFDIDNEGGQAQWQLKILADFFRALPFSQLRPTPELVNPPNLALAIPGQLYVVYAPRGGAVDVDLRGSNGTFEAAWLDPRDGRWRPAPALEGGAPRTLSAPDDRDWVLKLALRGAAPPPCQSAVLDLFGAPVGSSMSCTMDLQIQPGGQPVLTYAVNDIDGQGEGTWQVNGGPANPVPVTGDGTTVTFEHPLDPAELKAGQNTVTFTFASDLGGTTTGFRVSDISVLWQDPGPIFADVPADHWASAEIELLYRGGYVAGCSSDPLLYCPEQGMLRSESAVFILRGEHGGGYMPPAPVEQVFADVPLESWYAKWAEALWRQGFTAGCATEPLRYCPAQIHTIAEGSVFFLRMRNGADYEPPPASGLFADTPVDRWYARWVEAAYQQGILLPCQTEPQLLACPEDPLTRAMGAYMMVQAKGLGP